MKKVIRNYQLESEEEEEEEKCHDPETIFKRNLIFLSRQGI